MAEKIISFVFQIMIEVAADSLIAAFRLQNVVLLVTSVFGLTCLILGAYAALQWLAMKIIAALAVVSASLVNVFGSKSSVGGPMTELLLSFMIMLAAGVAFAWSNGLGVLGWLISIVVAIIGGVAGIMLLGLAMEAALDALHFQGRLVDTKWAYFAATATALGAVLASWVPLEVGNRFIMWRRHES